MDVKDVVFQGLSEHVPTTRLVASENLLKSANEGSRRGASIRVLEIFRRGRVQERGINRGRAGEKFRIHFKGGRRLSEIVRVASSLGESNVKMLIAGRRTGVGVRLWVNIWS